MAKIQLPQYHEFVAKDDPTDATRWSDWLEGFEAMVRAMLVKDKKDQHAMLVHYIGQHCRKLLKKLPNNGTEEEDYVKAKKALTDYFTPTMNKC